jgi:hypothetical protein
MSMTQAQAEELYRLSIEQLLHRLSKPKVSVEYLAVARYFLRDSQAVLTLSPAVISKLQRMYELVPALVTKALTEGRHTASMLGEARALLTMHGITARPQAPEEAASWARGETPGAQDVPFQ